ncbi:MAG TPA: DUF1684 domain-containing protein [Bryobacteraceae bacterium]|nr:DUF1684 domain-containing protein [Bryobacteraceae bacterium]
MFRILIGIAGMLALFLSSDSYTDSVREWQTARNQKLRAPDSWLTLVGLFWLQPGDNTIGSADANDFVLPKNSAPAHAGVLHLDGNKVTFRPQSGPVRSLNFDEEKPDIVKTGSVSFYAIEREGKIGIRAKDSESPVLKNFSGLKYFPVNPALHFEAKFLKDEKKIPILNILGQTEQQESPGIVEFAYQGKTHHLRPIFEGKTLFFLFKDATNKTQTYQAGRMLNTPLPVDGKVDLDFNHSYNPPCTFTPYATCPLPPKENTLPFAVEAGELRYQQDHAEFSASR